MIIIELNYDKTIGGCLAHGNAHPFIDCIKVGVLTDPTCGSGGMFIQSEKFVEEHKGKIENLSIYGQELNSTTWKLCRMNLAIRGLDGNLGPHHDDTFHNDLHKMLKADYILANPPFNISDWGGNKLTEDVRWKYGTPQKEMQIMHG